MCPALGVGPHSSHHGGACIVMQGPALRSHFALGDGVRLSPSSKSL